VVPAWLILCKTYTFTFEQATTQKKLHEVVDLTFDVFEAKSMN
jgi:hypothetical protein